MSLKPKFDVREFDFTDACFGFDVDGTLVEGLQDNAEHNFGDVVGMLVELWRRKAKEVFFATGRPPWALRNWVLNTFQGYEDLPEYEKIMSANHVMFDGALIGSLRGDVLFEKSIPSEVVDDLMDFMSNFGVGFGFDTTEGYFVSEGYNENYFPSEGYGSLSELNGRDVYAGYLINFDNEEVAKDALDELEDKYRGMLHFSYFKSFQSGDCIVVNPYGVDKAKGIQRKFELESGGEFSRLVFFGDGENDECVFEWATSDSKILAVPSPKTSVRKHRLLELSKWRVPDEGSVCEVLGVRGDEGLSDMDVK